MISRAYWIVWKHFSLTTQLTHPSQGLDDSMSGNVKFIIETEGFDDGSED